MGKLNGIQQGSDFNPKNTQYIRTASDTDVRTTHSGHVFATECESGSFVGSLALADVVLCACVRLVPSLSVQRDAPFERHSSREVWVRFDCRWQTAGFGVSKWFNIQSVQRRSSTMMEHSAGTLLPSRRNEIYTRWCYAFMCRRNGSAGWWRVVEK